MVSIRRSPFAFATLATLSMVAACGGEEPATLATAEAEIAAATLRLAPAPGSSADFGSVLIGSPVVQTFVVSNVGTRQSTSRIAFSLSGAGAPFALLPVAAGDCLGNVTTLAPGTSCTARVQFAPTTAAPASATLTARARVGGVASLTLTGLGRTPGLLAISPSTLNFGVVVLGAVGGQAVLTVRNDGSSPTGAMAITLGGASPSDFRILSTTCAGPLPPAATCAINLAFGPVQAGARAAQLTVAASPGGTVVALLTGTAVTPAALVIAPGNFSFGNVLVGSASPPATLVVTNAGGMPTGALATSLAGPDFAVTVSSCSGVALQPGQTCTVSVAFLPAVTGARAGTLSVSAAPGGSATVALSGDAL